jgi:hypothetical protein
MATKRGATKKGAARKSASKRGATKKGASKKGIGIPPFQINLECIAACAERYQECLSKGVSRDICMKRLVKNLANCQRGIFPRDAG